jgi:hypothetical protein
VCGDFTKYQTSFVSFLPILSLDPQAGFGFDGSTSLGFIAEKLDIEEL